MKQLLILPLFIYNFAFGQIQDDILKTQILKKGVYSNFREFRINSPSISGQIEFKEKSEAARILIGSNKNKLFVTDETGERKRLNKQIWGFCDGEEVYIFWDLGLRRYFNKLITIDRYCFFLDDGYTSAGAGVNGFSMAVPIKYEIDYVLNINNGKTYKLKNKLMKLLLGKDTELLKRYNSDNNKRSKREEYIIEFCSRNQNLIGPIKETYETE